MLFYPLIHEILEHIHIFFPVCLPGTPRSCHRCLQQQQNKKKQKNLAGLSKTSVEKKEREENDDNCKGFCVHANAVTVN